MTLLPTRVAILVLASGLAMGLGNAALAQTQDGRALERNLRVGGGKEKFGPRASMRDEVQLRNALITGNVGGGKAFRGNVGYSAPGEFQGSTAGDSSFRFRRDSTSAGSLRGGDALSYQFSRTSGRGGTSDTFSRIGATGRAAIAAGPGNAGSTFAATGTNAFRSRPGTLRSTSAFTASQGLGASVVGYEATDSGYTAITASTLLGVRRGGLAEVGSTTPAQRAAREDATRPKLPTSLSQPLDTTAIGAERMDLSANPGGVNAGRTRTIADDLNDRLRVRTPSRTLEPGTLPEPPSAPQPPSPALAPDTAMPPGESAQPATNPTDAALPATGDTTASEVQQRLKVLREKLIPKGSRLGEKPVPSTTDDGKPREDRDGDGLPDEAPRSGIDQETIRLIREAGGRTRQFIDPATGKADPFAEGMTLGQELLGQGKFFDAEEKFARALEERPGDPAAMAARMHAQMGAGLYLSAALNLRTLMAEHPELAGLRYTGDTIPKPERLRSIAADLRTNVQRAKDASVTPSSADGLLIAYLGWQLGDQAMTTEGLATAKAGLKMVPGVGQQPEAAALLELLEGVWVTPDGTK